MVTSDRSCIEMMMMMMMMSAELTGISDYKPLHLHLHSPVRLEKFCRRRLKFAPSKMNTIARKLMNYRPRFSPWENGIAVEG